MSRYLGESHCVMVRLTGAQSGRGASVCLHGRVLICHPGLPTPQVCCLYQGFLLPQEGLGCTRKAPPKKLGISPGAREINQAGTQFLRQAGKQFCFSKLWNNQDLTVYMFANMYTVRSWLFQSLEKQNCFPACLRNCVPAWLISLAPGEMPNFFGGAFLVHPKPSWGRRKPW